MPYINQSPSHTVNLRTLWQHPSLEGNLDIHFNVIDWRVLNKERMRNIYESWKGLGKTTKSPMKSST
eukprot:m.128275 g.128275  ORF g.128275 m.128275 type:complete len:67 (+) comp17425_c0_seq2:2801-3001(+)